MGLFGRLRGQRDGDSGPLADAFDERAGLQLELDPELSARLRQAAERRGRHPRALVHDLLVDGLEQALRRRQAQAVLDQLTPRQQQVAKLTTRGYTNHQIAEALVVSPGDGQDPHPPRTGAVRRRQQGRPARFAARSQDPLVGGRFLTGHRLTGSPTRVSSQWAGTGPFALCGPKPCPRRHSPSTPHAASMTSSDEPTISPPPLRAGPSR